ncbi:MAG: molecular chaperone HtpG, partial [Clostridia bacterium]|nr:molecular chaperone HtpG [Clostridia bacterium]
SGLTEEGEEGKDLDENQLQDLFRKALGNETLPVKLAAMANSDLIAIVTEDEQGRRMREAYRMMNIPASYTLVLNRRNATVAALALRDAEDETTKLLCEQVYDLARMAAKPLEAEQITEFLTRSQKLVSMLVK